LPATDTVSFREIRHRIELWLGRIHLASWLIGIIVAAVTTTVAVVTAVAGYLGVSLGQAPLFQLIPAVLMAMAASAWLTNRLFGLMGTRYKSPRNELSSMRNFLIYLDHADQQTKIGFTPTNNIARLRIRLDYSNFLEGLIGAGNMWTMPRGLVIADLRDVVSGVRQTVPLTQSFEITHPNEPARYSRRWVGGAEWRSANAIWSLPWSGSFYCR
jgi:hypothetical protein